MRPSLFDTKKRKKTVMVLCLNDDWLADSDVRDGDWKRVKNILSYCFRFLPWWEKLILIKTSSFIVFDSHHGGENLFWSKVFNASSYLANRQTEKVELAFGNIWQHLSTFGTIWQPMLWQLWPLVYATKTNSFIQRTFSGLWTTLPTRYVLGVKCNEPNFRQTIYSSFLIWFTDSSSGMVGLIF